jgi:hypothetical protein
MYQLLLGVALAVLLGGCAVISVVDTAVSVTATVVETTVDVAAAVVDVAIPDDDDEENKEDE